MCQDASPASRDHEMYDLSGEKKFKRRRKVECKEHKGEAIKFVCKDCHKAVCQTCCVIYHRKCESVVTMESLLPTMKNHLREKVEKLWKKMNRKQKLVRKTHTKITRIEKTKVDIENHITSAFERVITNIRQKETQLMKEIMVITNKQIQQLMADFELEEIEMQMYRQHCEFFNQALLSDCEMDLYDAYQAWESGAVEMEDVRDAEAADTRRIGDIRFTPDTDKFLKVLDNLQLGKIDVTYQNQEQYLPSPVLVDTIDGRVSGDDEEPDLLDVTVLVVDGVQTCVVTDYNNKCVKSFFTRNNHLCHSKLTLDKSPNGMTQFNENQMMVAVKESLQIITAVVTPDLVLVSTIAVRAEYFSLAVLNPSSIAAGTWDCVDILDMAGQVLRSVTRYNDVSLFTCPFYMCVTDKGNILVSDCVKTSVTCMTPVGDVVWRYAPTRDGAFIYPCGITTTSTGGILLVDRDRVIQLTESGEFVREYGNIVGNPRGLYVHKHDTTYVSENTQVLEFHIDPIISKI